MHEFETLLTLAFEEDLGSHGDVTSRAVFMEEQGRARLISKDKGILAGVPYFKRVFEKIDSSLSVDFLSDDGASLREGELVARLEGNVLSLLSGERTAINFLSFLSGIATETARYVKEASFASESRAVILDTRKTLPGYRKLSKYAVSLGGACNHRMGLFDMVMIKDNHIDAAGSITNAVERVRTKWGDRFSIEVETRNLHEVKEALENRVEFIMLDNMDEETCAKAVSLGAGLAVFEASGNMNLERVGSYSRTGVDRISVGSLTHSVRAFDFSLKIETHE